MTGWFSSPRAQRLLAGVDKARLGLEIGPSHRPTAAKRDGFNVRILDHLNTEDLKQKYQAHGVKISDIEPVDYVWKGERLRDLVGEERFAWIVASHMIEHTPDLIGFLRDCQDILTPDGIVSLAVPDKRFCFDFVRDVTSLAQVIDAHLLERKTHSPGAIVDYLMNVVTRHGAIAWGNRGADGLAFSHPLSFVTNLMPQLRDAPYFDLHAWCFTPSSFRLLMIDLNLLGFIGLAEDQFFDTVGHEFFVTLKAGVASEDQRMALQLAKLREIASQTA